jgi:hypothetical protein
MAAAVQMWAFCTYRRAWSWQGLRPGAAGAVALPARWCLANAA